MNSILQSSSERVKAIQKNMAKYKFKVSLDKLGVSKYFHFNTAFRDDVIKGSSTNIDESPNNVNFESTIDDP